MCVFTPASYSLRMQQRKKEIWELNDLSQRWRSYHLDLRGRKRILEGDFRSVLVDFFPLIRWEVSSHFVNVVICTVCSCKLLIYAFPQPLPCGGGVGESVTKGSSATGIFMNWGKLTASRESIKYTCIDWDTNKTFGHFHLSAECKWQLTRLCVCTVVVEAFKKALKI